MNAKGVFLNGFLSLLYEIRNNQEFVLKYLYLYYMIFWRKNFVIGFFNYTMWLYKDEFSG